MLPNTSQGAYYTLPPSCKLKEGQSKRFSFRETLKARNDVALIPTYNFVDRKIRKAMKGHDDALPPYKKLKSDSANSSSFGLSNDLSTESIKNACECFEFSDDDFFRTSVAFQRRSLRCRFGSGPLNNHHNMKINPFCTVRRVPVSNPLNERDVEHKESSLTLNQQEALTVLNELDAILDGHTKSISDGAAPSEQSEKVEDCLLELDTYLDQMEDDSTGKFNDHEVNYSKQNIEKQRPQTLPKRMQDSSFGREGSPLSRSFLRKSFCSSVAPRMDRDEYLPSTILSNIDKTSSTTPATSKRWRRNSMRKTSLLSLNNIPGGNTQETPSNQELESSFEPDHVQQPSDLSAAIRRCNSQIEFRPNVLTTNDILQEMVRNSVEDQMQAQNRPRQYGRRAEGNQRIFSINFGESCGTYLNTDRPMSAPTGNSSECAMQNVETSTAGTRGEFGGSEPSSVASTRNPSPVSLVSTIGSSSMESTTIDQPSTNIASNPPLERGDIPLRILNLDPESTQTTTKDFNVEWPHAYSRVLALFYCTLGLFNICRFATQTIHYGGNFLLQFLLLSVIFGIPFFWLQMCLGSKIKSGPVSMWRVSPICRGIGIALILGQGIMALYSTISISWLLVYLKDSFLTKSQPVYRWQEPFLMYHKANVSGNITETVADYFNGFVLQRLHLGRKGLNSEVRFQVRDRLAFNLAIIWTLVFLILCKGLKSYGKVAVGLTVGPLGLFIVITFRFLYYIGFSNAQNIFSASDFEDFLINPKTWTAAAQEAFLTWGLLGGSAISMCSRSCIKNNNKFVLRREAILVVLLTLLALCLAGVFGFSCDQILSKSDYIYIPGSFENTDSSLSVFSLKEPISPALASFPMKWAPHYSSLVGETYHRSPVFSYRHSDYQALRLITELFPAAMAISHGAISWVWTALTFFMFILFGLGQVCAIWKPISCALGNSTSSVLLSCVTGLLLGIPFATEMGISIVHYLDLIFGGAWWLLILWTAEILAIFLICGRPYSSDILVNDLRMTSSMSAFLALSWNVLLPIGLISLAIIQYKVSLAGQFYHWRGKAYFSFWTRKIAGMLQIGFLLILPITAIIQIYRYLSKGPPDFLDRIQLLYRPSQSPVSYQQRRVPADQNTTAQPNAQNNVRTSDADVNRTDDDAPPKYTPPPSYTTATGARLAKILRQSIRRSVRRFMGDTTRTRPVLISEETTIHLPPEYSAVLPPEVQSPSVSNTANNDISPTSSSGTGALRTQSLGRNQRAQKYTEEGATSIQLRPYTSSDVANVLRAPIRQGELNTISVGSSINQLLRSTSSWSAENLVINAAPLGESNAIALNASSNSLPNYPPDIIDNCENTSVI